MDNEEFFSDKLEESGEIQVEISEEHNKKLRQLAKLFKYTFGKDVGDYTLLLNSLFYTDGVPGENSIARVTKLIDNFALLVHYYKFLGRFDKIEKRLNSYGIGLEVKPLILIVNDNTNPEKFEKVWNSVFPYNFPEELRDKKVLLQFLLDEGVKEKKAILALEKEVKEVHAEDVKIKCDVEKPNFLKAVRIKTRKLKGKDSTDQLNKLEKDIKNLNDISEVLA